LPVNVTILVGWLSYWHCSRNMRRRVHETVERPSDCPCFCPIGRQQRRWPAGLLLCARRAKDIDRQLPAPRTSSRRRCSAANAGSVMLTTEGRGWTQTCLSYVHPSQRGKSFIYPRFCWHCEAEKLNADLSEKNSSLLAGGYRLRAVCLGYRQEAQLSPRDRAMRRLSLNLTNFTTQQCTNYLYNKSWTNRSYEVRGLRWADV